MLFSELSLSMPLQRAVDAIGYQETTPIQAQAIPPALEGRDVIGCAQTGTGKTEAFLLPALQRMLDDDRGNGDGQARSKEPRVVVVAPTRELVIQVAQQAQKLAVHTALRVVAVYGGAQMRQQTDRLRRGADVVVATPGRLLDHLHRRHVSLKRVQVLVLDEADRMLDMGFLPDIREIVSSAPEERQTLLFSATMPPAVSALARHFQHDPVRIEIDMARPPEAVRQALYPVPKHLKTQLVVALLKQTQAESVLIFTDTKQEADVLTRHLFEAGVPVACMHGDFKQRERIAALEGFRSGKHRVLVATNVAARGLDVEGISHVVNYDVPEHAEDYVHRVGRTARAEADGDAITLVTPDDEPLIARIEYLLGHKIERKTLPGFDYDVPTPSWARPSAKALVRQNTQPLNLADRWRSMSRGKR